MDTRITAPIQVSRAVVYMRKQATELANLQNDIGTGIRLHRSSDDPSNYAVVNTGKSQIRRFDTYLQNISDATDNLNQGVSALTEVHKVLGRASELAAQGANSATDEFGYQAIATEVDGLIDRLVDMANGQANGRYLFGGTTTDKPPFVISATDPAGRPTAIQYQGSDERARTLVGVSLTVDTHYSGNAVFQPPGADVFQTLINLREELRDSSLGNTAKASVLSQRLASLEQVRNSVLDSVGEQSSTLQNLEALQSRVRDLHMNTEIRVSELESTDYAEAIVQVREQENIFQATLATSAKIFDQSLLDFIR